MAFVILLFLLLAPEAEQQALRRLLDAQTREARESALRELSLVGGKASVAAIAPLLVKPETVEMARYALERNPSPEAVAVLRNALNQVDGRAQAGIVNSLGRRRDAASVKLIVPLLNSSDADIAGAAATALGYIGGAVARDALLSVKSPGAEVHDALLRIAERQKDPAIYKRLYAAENPEPVRIAALRGLAAASPEAAVTAFKAGTPAVRSAAVHFLPDAALTSALEGAEPRLQVQILAALAARGTGLQASEKLLTSPSEAVRTAALHALGKVGTRGSVTTLAERAASAAGEEQAAARVSLARLRADGTDAAILDAIGSAEPKVRVELIRAVGERGVRNAPEILLKTAAASEPAVRRESIRALRETAGPEHVAPLVRTLAAVEDESERKEYERAVAAAIRRSKDAPVGELLGAWKSTADPDVRASLLSVMATVGNDDALPVMREALASREADLQRAAILAMTEWPNTAPAADLLKLAQSVANASQQVLALRGYVKLVQLPADRSPAQTVTMLSSAMSAARRADEKKLVIAALARVPAPESLEFVRKFVDDAAVAAEAKMAITNLERALSYRR